MRLILDTFKFMLKLELRSKKEGKISYERILLIFVINFLWFLMLGSGIALSKSQNQNFDSFLLDFSFILLSIEFLLLIFMILIEFDTAVLNIGEIEFFLSIPIDSRTYRAGKYLSFLSFVLFLNLSYNLSPTLVLAFVNSFGYPISTVDTLKVLCAYFLTSTFFVVLISNFMLLIMLLVGRKLKLRKLKKFIYPIQISAVFLTFLIYQIVNKYFSTQNDGADIFKWVDEKFSSFSFLIPQVIFSKIFVWMSGMGSVDLNFIEIVSLLIISSVLLIAPFYALKIENLQNISTIFEPSNDAKSYRFLKFLRKAKQIFFKSSVEFAFYELVYIHLRRDKSVMVKIFSTFAISVAIAIYILFFEELSNPLNMPISRANILMLTSLFFTVSAGITAISSHRNYEASWVYHFIPKEKIFEAINGGFKVLWHHILIPQLAIFTLVYSISFGEVVQVFIHILTTSVLLKIFFNLTALISIHLPFSQRIEKLSSADKLLIQTFPFFGVIISIFFENGLYRLITNFGSFLLFGLMLFLAFAFERYTNSLLKQKLKKDFVWQISEG